MANYEPYDPSKPAERMADSFRKRVADMALRAMTDPQYKDVNSVEQIEAVIGGVLTGLVGVCFASIEPAGRDAIVEAIQDYLPQARDQAEAIIESGGKIN